jgi:hypothetical protein
MKITTFDIAENTQDEREPNAKELAQMAKDRAEADALEAEAKAKATAKAALLSKLGITAEEAALLLS